MKKLLMLCVALSMHNTLCMDKLNLKKRLSPKKMPSNNIYLALYQQIVDDQAFEPPYANPVKKLQEELKTATIDAHSTGLDKIYGTILKKGLITTLFTKERIMWVAYQQQKYGKGKFDCWNQKGSDVLVRLYVPQGTTKQIPLTNYSILYALLNKIPNFLQLTQRHATKISWDKGFLEEQFKLNDLEKTLKEAAAESREFGLQKCTAICKDNNIPIAYIHKTLKKYKSSKS